jgi:hypothetical protein
VIDKRLKDIALQLSTSADQDPALRQLGKTVTDRFEQLLGGPDTSNARAALYLKAVDALDQPGGLDKLESRLADTGLFRRDVERALNRIDADYVKAEVRKVKDRAAADPAFRDRLAKVRGDVTPTGAAAKGEMGVTEYPPKEKGVQTDWVATAVIGVILLILIL